MTRKIRKADRWNNNKIDWNTRMKQSNSFLQKKKKRNNRLFLVFAVVVDTESSADGGAQEAQA